METTCDSNCVDCTSCKVLLPTEAATETTVATSEIPHLDNTKRAAFIKCRRKYYYQYVLNLKTFFGSTALRYGLTWHEGMEAFYGHIKDHGWQKDGKAFEAAVFAMQKGWDEASKKETFFDDYRTLENGLQAFLQYVNHYAADENMLVVTATERPFKVHMENETADEKRFFAGLKPFHFTGKIDLEIELNGRTWIKEHKTTGQPIETQANRLHRSAQVMGYTYAKIRDSGRKEAPEGALVSLSHLSASKSRTTGLYGKARIDFKRVPQIFSDNDLVQWRNAFLSTALDIQREAERNLWPMTHDACFDYGSCPFLEMCEQNKSVDDLYINDQKYYVAEPWEVAKDVEAGSVIY